MSSGHAGCGDGHTGRRLRIDLGNGEAVSETITPEHCRTYVGGGLEATRLLLTETDAGYDPLAAQAPLCFMSSAVTGHAAVGLARVIVVAKSPMTGGIGECRVEGPFGQALKSTGWDAVIVAGYAPRPSYVLIDADGAQILGAEDIWGTDTGSATDALEARHGRNAHCAVIGPAGERGVRFATIETDRTFAASRMGLGAVMGSKNLKGVVLLSGEAPRPADEVGLRALTVEYSRRIPGNDLTRSQQLAPGFGAWPTDGAALAGYGQGPNYGTSRIVELGDLTAQALIDRVEISEGNCPGCPGDCIKTFRNTIDNRAGGLHQEAVAAFALNLGLTDPDLVMDLNASCHLWGIDPVSLSFTVSMLCEAQQHGLLDGVDLGGHRAVFGDVDALTALMTGIATGAEEVAWLGRGVRSASQRLPAEARRFAMHVKGLEMVSFEPRASAGQALAYAVSPLGPRYEIVEHDLDFDPVGGWRHGLDMMRTLGTLDWEPMEILDDARVRRTVILLDMWSGMDAVGISLFAGPPVRELDLPDLARIVHLVTGWRTSDRELFAWGRRRWHLMRLFNLREGFTADDDTLPDRFFTEPIDDGRHRGVVIGREQFDRALAVYYELVGWDSSGWPTRAGLLEAGLDPALGEIGRT